MITWLLDPSNYFKWTEQERADMEAFLRAHDVDPRDVPIGGGSGASVSVRDTDGGRLLELWVFDRQDGSIVTCTTCPGCARQKRLSLPLVAEPPQISGAWSKPIQPARLGRRADVVLRRRTCPGGTP